MKGDSPKRKIVYCPVHTEETRSVNVTNNLSLCPKCLRMMITKEDNIQNKKDEGRGGIWFK